MSNSPLIDRVKRDSARDKSLADEARQSSDVAELHSLCMRLLSERSQLADALDSLITGWSLIRGGSAQPQAMAPSDKEAIYAIERVAHESIQFAREVLQALGPKTSKESD